MPVCPSQACPFWKRFGRPAEYRAGIEACSDCGAALVPDAEGPKALAAQALAPRGPIPWRRLGVTLLVPGVLLLLVRIPLAGVPADMLAGLAAAMPGWDGAQVLTLAALGAVPFLSGFVLVELAALAVPRWRRLRTCGPAGRARLDGWSLRAGALLALVQALGLANWLYSLATYGEFYGAEVHRSLVALSLTAASVTVALLARYVSRQGLMNGFVAVIAFGALSQLGARELALLQSEVVLPAQLVVGVLLLGAVGFGTLWLMRPAAGGIRAAPVPSPAAGVAPVAVVLYLSKNLQLLEPLAGGLTPLSGTGVQLALVLPISVGCALLFYRPLLIARVERQLGMTATVVARAHELRQCMPRLVLVSAAYCGGLVGVDWMIGQAMGIPGLLDAATAAVLAAVAMDLRDEWRARRASPSLVTVWTFSQVYAVAPAVAALAAEGITATPRGARYRILGQVFVPWAPVEVLVAAEDAARARRLLDERLADPAVPVPAVGAAEGEAAA